MSYWGKKCLYEAIGVFLRQYMSFWGNKCLFEAVLINVKATIMILIVQFHYHFFSSSGRSIILDNLSEGKRGRIRVCVIPTISLLLLYLALCFLFHIASRFLFHIASCFIFLIAGRQEVRTWRPCGEQGLQKRDQVPCWCQPVLYEKINSLLSGLVSMARTPEHQPILMELSLKAPMLEIGHSMVLKLWGDSNKVAASKASDDINL